MAAGLLIGGRAALRSRRTIATSAAATVAVLTMTGAILSQAHLHRRASAEAPAPVAQALPELAALRSDPLWAALPDATPSKSGSYPASRLATGETTPSGVWRVLGATQDHQLFLDAVAAAEATGWRLSSASCFAEADAATAELAKELSVGPATLIIEVASYSAGVRVDVSARKGFVGSTERCWEKAWRRSTASPR